jgi:hypothetical protein
MKPIKLLSAIVIITLIGCRELRDDKPIPKTETSAVETQENSREIICGFDFRKLPEFVGGNLKMGKYISKNLSLDKLESKPSGKIFVSFDVLEDGKIENVEILKGAEKSPILRQNLIAIFQNMPKWSPGEDYTGKAIKIKMVFPVLVKI